MFPNLRRAFTRWGEDDGGLLAAAVAYYASISLFPVLLLLIAGIGIFLEWTHLGQDAERQVLTAIGEQFSPALAEHVRQVFAQVRQNAAIGGPIGFATLLLAAIAIFAQFERAFDRIWDVKDPAGLGIWATVKNLLLYRLRAFLILVGLGAVVIVVFIAGLTLSALKAYVHDFLPLADWTWWIVQTGTTVVLNVFVFTVMYVALPKAPVQWIHALRGGALAAVSWEIGRQVLALYVIGEKYSTYGVVGSLLAILLWVYYGVAVVFLGAEYIQVLSGNYHGQASQAARESQGSSPSPKKAAAAERP